jgi:hypothetical protein
VAPQRRREEAEDAEQLVVAVGRARRVDAEHLAEARRRPEPHRAGLVLDEPRAHELPRDALEAARPRGVLLRRLEERLRGLEVFQELLGARRRLELELAEVELRLAHACRRVLRASFGGCGRSRVPFDGVLQRRFDEVLRRF